jgi:hypothetical protein
MATRADDFIRALGKLEGDVASIKDTVARMLDGQQEIREEGDDSRRRIHERMDRHQAEDMATFRMLRDTLDGMSGRIGNLERIADAVESNGQAIMELEGRMEKWDEAARLRESIYQTNRWWLRGIAGLLAAIIGDKITGGRLAKWIEGLFR